MKYRLGLDIGIASVGWAVVECDDNGEPLRIERIGVRTFDKAEVGKKGESPASQRRSSRTSRRRTRRRAHRIERVRNLCTLAFGKNVTDDAQLNRDDVFYLRYHALDNAVTPSQLTRLLVYLAKHRGSKHLAKCKIDKKEQLAVLPEQYRTWGELIYLDQGENKRFEIVNGKRAYSVRNHEGQNGFQYKRDDVQKEAQLILSKQVELQVVSQAFADKYMEIFCSQRSFDEGPALPSPYHKDGFEDLVGYCTFYNKASGNPQLRAPKATFTQEYATALQKINNVVLSVNGEECDLTQEQRQLLYDKITTVKELKYFDARKLLGLSSDTLFNVTYSTDGKKTTDATEKDKVLFTMKNSWAIKQCLDEHHQNDVVLLDEIATVLTNYKSDNARASKLEGKVSATELDKLLELDPKGHGHLSTLALQQITPYLLQGHRYSDACDLANLGTVNALNAKTLLLKGSNITELVNDIASPVVKRSVSQTLKVINAIIQRYGSPTTVSIELAREMSKDFDERQKMTKQNSYWESKRKERENELKDKFGIINPKGIDLLKYQLYEEQECKCAYSLQKFDLARLFEVGYAEIDHIIPYSRCFDDSQSNKVLVLSKENQNKRNRTPFEYMGNDEERWQKFTAFVRTAFSSPTFKKKRENLLRKKFSEENEKDWKSRNLNDTRYVSRFMFNLVQNNLQLDKIEGKKKQVFSINGKITDYCRKNWGLTKVRKDGDKHHALDASVIACVSQGTITKISEYHKVKESHAIWHEGKRAYVHPQTGELLTNDQYDQQLKFVPQPYKNFRDDLIIHLHDHPQALIENDMFYQNVAQTLQTGKQILPIFVSRMPNKKATGAIHKEKKYSTRLTKDGNKYMQKTALEKLQLKDGQIVGYPEKFKRDDRLLYNALLQRLQQFNGDAKTAFAEPFYKPKSDGSNGSIVKKVFIEEKIGSGVRFDKTQSFAENASSSMVRVDVFTKNSKYYCVPIYTKDMYSKRLPNRAIVQGKDEENWDVMDDSYTFLFSIASNELLYIENKKGFNLEDNDKNKTTVTSGYFYYKGIDRATGASAIVSHDSKLKGRVYFKGLEKLQKCQVDILGNVSIVQKETRQNTEWLHK